METRFWEKVNICQPNECWPWMASQWEGYGMFRVKGKTLSSHRVAYELLVGAIPSGLELDHVCRNRACCNPMHLEPVTHAMNMARGDNAMKTHCVHGHEYTTENTFVYEKGARKGRMCRACHRAAWHKRAAQRKQQGDRS